MESFKVNILQGKYKEAKITCDNMGKESIRDVVLELAYDTESICVYSFIRYMIEQNKDVNWIKLAIEIMINPLCFVEGAYSIALFHTRELLKIEKNVENLERILFFYNIPEKLINREEAQYIAQEIIKIEPYNKVALSI